MLRYHPTYHNATAVPWQGDPAQVARPVCKLGFQRRSCDGATAERVARMARDCARFRTGVFLVANREGILEALSKALCLLAPGLKIAGGWAGCVTTGSSADLIEAINQSGAGAVFVSLGDAAERDWITRYGGDLRPGIVLGLGKEFATIACETFMSRASPDTLASPSVAGRPALPDLRARLRALRQPVTQRLVDLLVAGAALAVAAPLMILMAGAVRLDSGGPAIFRQTRIGRGGQPFTIYKFRTMHTDQRQGDPARCAASDREGPCFKARQDPRVTRVGKLLRRSSLDELPQLFNVLKGEMSIVGPRPGLASEVAAYSPQALRRLAVKPGITGIWQVSGRADISFDRMIRMDLRYVRTRCVLGDLRIIARTFGVVLTGRGAY